MGSFVNPDERVEIVEFDSQEVISDTPPRVAIIRAKMPFGISKKVENALLQLGADGKTIELRPGDNQIELLKVNLMGWRGGDLDGVPCTPDNIARLDPTDPFWDRVLEEIGQRNRKRKDFDPNARTTNGAAPTTASVSPALLESGISS